MDILEAGKDSQKSSLGMWMRRHLPCISDDSGDEERRFTPVVGMDAYLA